MKVTLEGEVKVTSYMSKTLDSRTKSGVRETGMRWLVVLTLPGVHRTMSLAGPFITEAEAIAVLPSIEAEFTAAGV